MVATPRGVIVRPIRIAYYTRGSVGGGHFSPALAVKRGPDRAGIPADSACFTNNFRCASHPGLSSFV
jgi:hypothetical protein